MRMILFSTSSNVLGTAAPSAPQSLFPRVSSHNSRLLTGSYNNNFYICDAFGTGTSPLSQISWAQVNQVSLRWLPWSLAWQMASSLSLSTWIPRRKSFTPPGIPLKTLSRLVPKTSGAHLSAFLADLFFFAHLTCSYLYLQKSAE